MYLDFANQLIFKLKMSDLLGKSEQFVHSAELVDSEPTWAYLHSHKLREMSYLDQDYEELALCDQPAQDAQASQPGKKEPIERFASIMDTEDPKFEKQRQESIKGNI